MTFHRSPILTLVILTCSVLWTGCGVWEHRSQYQSDIDQYVGLAEGLRYAQVMKDVDGKSIDLSNEAIPATVDDEPRTPYPLSIEEAVQNALTNSRILRDLGARLVRAPESARSIMDPAIVESDPITGIEGALSEFDATLAGSFFAENNDFAANNLFQLQGADTFKQDFGIFQLELGKQSATGTQFFLRKNIDYDANNSPANRFPSAWNTNVEAEFRHPLLQGSGVAFNRIAGPNGTPKNFNGIVLARLNTDISQIDFEIAIRDLINNVENAYWDLYFAYRQLDSKIKARDAALETLKKIQAREGMQNSGDDVLVELASEQYWEFEEEVINARAGRIVDGTRSNNGSHAGTFNGTVGLQVAERRLRLLMGWPINDDREIRPLRDPAMAEVTFDWQNAVDEAQTRRAEIRKQELRLKSRGLELAATRNFLLQRVDLVGLYRYRGFGQRLISSNTEDRFNSAYQDLLSGDFQEWRVGIETAFPIGMRQAHAAVRAAQLQYSREQAILDELTRDVVHNLSNEYANVRRAYKAMQISFNRRFAAQKRVAILLDREEKFGVNFREVLSAQRRAANADSRFFRSLVDYIVAIKNVHFEKGSLLRYNNIYLAEQSPSELLEANSNGPSEIDYSINPTKPTGLPRFENEIEGLENTSNSNAPNNNTLDNPSDNAPSNSIPGNNVPGNNLPGNNLPGNNLPGNNVPGNNLPGNEGQLNNREITPMGTPSKSSPSILSNPSSSPTNPTSGVNPKARTNPQAPVVPGTQTPGTQTPSIQVPKAQNELPPAGYPSGSQSSIFRSAKPKSNLARRPGSFRQLPSADSTPKLRSQSRSQTPSSKPVNSGASKPQYFEAPSFLPSKSRTQESGTSRRTSGNSVTTSERPSSPGQPPVFQPLATNPQNKPQNKPIQSEPAAVAFRPFPTDAPPQRASNIPDFSSKSNITPSSFQAPVPKREPEEKLLPTKFDKPNGKTKIWSNSSRKSKPKSVFDEDITVGIDPF